jgi:hypothetical protein
VYGAPANSRLSGRAIASGYVPSAIKYRPDPEVSLLTLRFPLTLGLFGVYNCLRARRAFRQTMGINTNQKAYAQTITNAEPIGCAIEAAM